MIVETTVTRMELNLQQAMFDKTHNLVMNTIMEEFLIHCLVLK